jgi:hypothetical protein
MKKFVVVIFIILFLMASVANAWHLSWGVQPEADGFTLYHNDVLLPGNVATTDVGNVNKFDLETLGLTKGERYEMWLTAYSDAGISGDSDHIRWTYPTETIVIEMLGAPVQIIISP